MQTAYNLLQFEVLSCAFPAILKDAAKSNVVNHLWHINPCLTLRGFVGAHSDPSCLLRIIDVCQDMKVCTDTVTLSSFQRQTILLQLLQYLFYFCKLGVILLETKNGARAHGGCFF
jgi:hypothetical protein